MNPQALPRGNRFRIPAKPTGPHPLAPQPSQEGKGAVTSRSETRTRDKHALTVRHQNMEPCSRENTSLSTQYRAPLARPSHQRSHKEECLSPRAVPLGSPRMASKHKINYSILQRIHRALELYPSIAQQHPPLVSLPTYATQSEDEYEPEGRINLSKLVLWRESKLLKATERVYDWLGEERDEKMKGPKRGKEGCMQAGLREYLLARHKTDKLCRQNFINLCYSLYYYYDKAHYEHRLANTPSSHTKLNRITTFMQFLHLQHSEQHLSFFLYSRSLVHSITPEGQPLSHEQLREFVALLSQGDANLYRYYKDYLMRKLGRLNQYQSHQVLHALLSNFQNKQSSPSLAGDSSQPVGEGGSSTTSLLGVAYDRQFWKTDPPPQQNMQEDLYEQLLEQIGRQTKKLMGYFQVQSGRHREAVSELVLIKAIRMLNAAHGIDKYRWFKELQLVKERVLLAKSADFAELQALHHDLREILQSHLHSRLEGSRVVDFAKRLLTTRAFVDKLQQLFQLFGQ